MGFCIANLILPAKAYVLKLNVTSLARNLNWHLLDVVPLTVLYVDIVYLCLFLQTVEAGAIL